MLFRDQNGKLVDQPLRLPDNADSFELQMQNFVDAVAGRAAPANSAQQAVYLMEMLDAIYLSSSTGHEVPITRA
jgi:predicted dehydrogenase